MNKALGVALLAVGAVLIGFGINASDSLGSEISRFFTGTPTDKSIWLLVCGVLAATVGLFLSLARSSKA
jgi:hypothetical protein